MIYIMNNFENNSLKAFGEWSKWCFDDYSTCSEGHAPFYKQLYSRVRKRYPMARFIMESYNVI